MWAIYVFAVTSLAISSAAASKTTSTCDQMMLQTKATQGHLSNSAFCCHSAESSNDVCGTCWPGAVASLGSYCASESRCGGCGGTWCAGAGDTLPPTETPSLDPTPWPSHAPTAVPSAVPTRDPTSAPTPVPSAAATPVPTSVPTSPSSTPAPELPAGECSDDASDCTNTKCCADPGMQCYEKNDYWASCKQACSPGVQDSDPIEYRTPWTCKVLGASSGPTPSIPALPTPSSSPTRSSDWDSRPMKMTHYWDCSGQGCDATVLQPWDPAKYVSPPGYGPQDPNNFGGAVYGEKMWLTGAASDVLANLIGSDDGCCGADTESGGCGRCLLVQNPDSLHPDWTAVVMKKNRCPPWTNGCGDSEPHFDIAAPGFDNLQFSTANICGAAGTGFDNQIQSDAVGSWWTQCGNTAECAHLCDQLPTRFVSGCKLFASWGWTRGDPESVRFRPVACPDAFTAHVGSQFDEKGVTN